MKKGQKKKQPKKNKSFLRTALLLALAFALSSASLFMGYRDTQFLHSKPDVKVGVIYPLTGNLSQMGDAAKVAIRIFREELAKDSNNQLKYEFIIEDSQLNPAKSSAIAKKLINVDKVNVLVTIGSNVGNAVSPIAEKNNLIHFSMSTDENVAIGEHNFVVATHPQKEAEKMLQELEKRNIKNVALITQNQSATLVQSEEFRKVAQDSAINIISDEYVNDGTRDFKILIRKILDKKPDIIVIDMYVPEIQIFVKQLFETKPDANITAIGSFFRPDDKSMFDGDWFVNAAIATGEYVDKFEEKAKSTSTNYSEGLYTALKIYHQAYQGTGGNIEEIIINLLNIRDFDSPLGKVYFNRMGYLQAPAVVLIVKNGKPIVLEN